MKKLPHQLANHERLLLIHYDFKAGSACAKLLITGQISEGHGKILASLDPLQQVELANRCVQKCWNVRKMETEAKKLQQKINFNEGPYSDANMQCLEVALSEHIGNRVQIECESKGGGYVRIRFNNIDELEGHFQRIGFEYEK